VTLGPDNWVIDGCPVNGPAVAARDSQVVVAWFTAADDAPKIRFSRSHDGGQQFAEPVDLAGAGSFGQVDVVLRDGVAFVSWWQRGASPGMDLVVQRINADDSLGEQRVISHTDATLPTDVPQMQVFNDQLYFAWSELGDDGGLYTATAPLW